MSLPLEIQFHIYEFLSGPDYYMVNIAAHTKFQKWKCKMIDEYHVGRGRCCKTWCGHQHANMRLEWKEASGIRIDNDNMIQNWEPRTTHVCLFCFIAGIDKFIKVHKRVPSYNADGIILYHTIENMRFIIDSDQYFKYCTSKEYKDIAKIKFHQNRFFIDTDYKDINEKYFKIPMLKYNIHKTKEQLKGNELSVIFYTDIVEKNKSDLKKLEDELKHHDLLPPEPENNCAIM